MHHSEHLWHIAFMFLLLLDLDISDKYDFQQKIAINHVSTSKLNSIEVLIDLYCIILSILLDLHTQYSPDQIQYQLNQFQLKMTQSTTIKHVLPLPTNHVLVTPYGICLQKDLRKFIQENMHLFNLKCCHQGKGKWTDRQQESYVRFLIENEEEMKERMLRKSQKVFLKMSKTVKTRTPDQCRSHHQKVLNIHKSLEEIIRYHAAKAEIFGSKADSQTCKPTSERVVSEEPLSPLFKLTSKGNNFRFQIEDSRISYY